MTSDLHHYTKNLWRWKCGLEEKDPQLPGYEELARDEWSPEFEKLMRNRMIMGAIWYGRLNAKGKPQYDRVEYMRTKLSLYEETGNLECLVDVAVLAVDEFEEGNHPLKHFGAEDGKIHAKEIT